MAFTGEAYTICSYVSLAKAGQMTKVLNYRVGENNPYKDGNEEPRKIDKIYHRDSISTMIADVYGNLSMLGLFLSALYVYFSITNNGMRYILQPF